MRIGEAAKVLGISAGWLRTMERNGKIPAPTRDVHGVRRYSEADVEIIRKAIYGETDRTS